MKIHNETIKESGTVLIRFGEAAVIGGVASLFVQNFYHVASSISIVGGFILVLLGLYLVTSLIYRSNNHVNSSNWTRKDRDCAFTFCIYWRHHHQSLAETAEEVMRI